MILDLNIFVLIVKNIYAKNALKMKIQKLMILSNKEKKENDAYSSQMKEALKLNYSKIFRCIKCWKIPKLQINELNNP